MWFVSEIRFVKKISVSPWYDVVFIIFVRHLQANVVPIIDHR